MKTNPTYIKKYAQNKKNKNNQNVIFSIKKEDENGNKKNVKIKEQDIDINNIEDDQQQQNRDSNIPIKDNELQKNTKNNKEQPQNSQQKQKQQQQESVKTTKNKKKDNEQHVNNNKNISIIDDKYQKADHVHIQQSDDDFSHYLQKVQNLIDNLKGASIQEKLLKEDPKNEKVDIGDRHLLRRWDVKVRELRVQSLQKEELNIFLVVKIGVQSANGQPQEGYYVDNSKTQKQVKSEILNEIKKGETREVDAGIDTEIHLSYDMLSTRFLIIEIWEYSRWKLNKFLGKQVMPLIQVAKGELRSSVVIKKAFGEKKGFVRVYFLAYFQEIWDFFINFYNWKAYNVVNKYMQPMDSALKITLKDKKGYNMSVKSHSYGYEDANPAWDKIPGYIQFRGTMDDLEDQLIEVQLLKKSLDINLTGDDQRKVLISLRGISDFDCLKGLIKLKQSQSKKKDNKGIQELNNSSLENSGEKQHNEVELKFDTAVYATVEGRINLNKLPLYTQKGEFIRYSKQEYYLCVLINRVENIIAPDDRGVINSFVTVKCGGTTKKTSTKQDNSKPDFNEELVFKIPIIQKQGLTQIGENEIKQQEKINEQIKDWLKKNNDITFILWIDGEDTMSDDNLGHCTISLSELQNAQLEPKQFVNYETRKQHDFVTRVLTSSSKFTSSRSDAGNIKINFQVYFAPDIDKAIDLRDFIDSQADKFQDSIQEKMKYRDDYQKCQYYQEYQHTIQNVFTAHPLERNAYTIFYKSIFVKDQYNTYHFIPKFVEKFSLPTVKQVSKNQSQQQSLANYTDDLSLETKKELAHYVRSIPLVKSKMDIWNSPEFMLSLREGTIIDHALLMAGLFMTVDEEKERQKLMTPEQRHSQKKNKESTNFFDIDFIKDKKDNLIPHIPIEDRVFICLGTLKNTQITAWIMVIEENLIDVTFWDVIEHKEYKLQGRIVENSKIGQTGKITKKNLKESVKHQLRKILHPLSSDLIEDLQGIKEKKVNMHQEEDSQKSGESDSDDDKQNNNEDEDRKKEEEQLLQDKTEFKQEVVQSQVVSLDNVMKKKNAKKSVGIRKFLESQVRVETESKQSFASGGKSVLKQPGSILKNSRLTHSKIGNNHHNGEGNFLSQHKNIQHELEMNNDATKFTKIADFVDNNGREMEEDVPDIPYKTLELVFNSRNVYANIQNQNPAQIRYHLHDENHWLPFISNEKQISEDHQTDERIIKIVKRWQGKIDTFWEGRNPNPELSAEKVKSKEIDIIDEIKVGIENQRSSLNMVTKWKSNSDQTTHKLIQLLRIQEYRDMGRKWVFNEEIDPVLKKSQEQHMEYSEIENIWEEEIKKMIPQDYQIVVVPLRFTYTDYMRIKAVVIENLEGIYSKKGKKLVFGIACKIFNYPNKINSVRVAIACYYNRTEAYQGEEEDEEDEENKDQITIQEEDEEDEDMDQEEEQLLNQQN